MTTEEFIQKAKQVHGNKYDYSKVEYVASKTKVCIICPKHGEFWQIPNSHLRGIGCSKCGKESAAKLQTATKDSFIERAKQMHGSQYDYSKVQYINSATKVCIICKQHGEFWQRPYAHTQGAGCPLCGKIKIRKKRAYSFEDFLLLAKKEHNDKYIYSKAKYHDYKTKICIVCREHGEFWQKPTDHIQGNGCPKCSHNLKLTTEDFIKKAKQIHKDKYDYSKVEYKNNREKVCIICPEHGEFLQSPNAHLRGAGCPLCAQQIRIYSLKDSLQDFIKKAQETHKGKYDYSKVHYINSTTKVCIICPEHGAFWQTPRDHIAGHGCRKCGGWYIYNEETFYKGAYAHHGKKYDYSNVDFRGSAHKVCIICPTHGKFWQLPHTHAYLGKGCPKCSFKSRVAARKTSSEYILAVARKYEFLKDFVKNESSLYGIAIKRNIDLGFLKRERHSNYTYKEVMDIAKSCKYASEFERKYGGAYNRARIMGWYDDITWFEPPEQYKGNLETKNHFVYAYENLTEHVVYVGLTNDIKRRHREHSRPHKHKKNTPVYEYFIAKGLVVPEPKILAQGLKPMESKDIEDWWIQYYKDEGWNILNVAKTGKVSGSIGAYTRIWTIEALRLEASKYKTRKEFSKGSPSAYTTAYKKGILSSLKLIDEHPAKRPIRNIETGEIFPSLSAAGKKYGISPDYISLAARGKRDSYAGFHWEFVENE